MNQIIGILAGLGAMAGWGFADFFAAKASKAKTPLQAVFLSQLLGLLVLGPIFLLTSRAFSLTPETLVLLAVLVLAYTLGLLSFYRSLEIGPISLTSPISSAYPLVVVLISVILLGEALAPKQWIAVGLILLGIFLASIHLERSKVDITRKQGILFALLAVALWGISIPYIGNMIGEAGWFPVTLLGYTFASAWLLLMFGWQGRATLWGSGPDRNILALTFFQLLATSSFFFGLERAPTSIVTPVSATYPIITAFLALTVLKEKVAKNHLIGAAIIIAGVVWLATAS